MPKAKKQNTQYQFTTEEKERITRSLTALAIAQAEFWDICRDIELEHDNLEIETDIYLLGEIATELDIPPSPEQLDPVAMWESFESHATAIIGEEE